VRPSQEVLVAAEPSQRSRPRAWRPEWCPHEHTNSPADRGGARHRDLWPRPDEGWNRAEAASSCHSRLSTLFRRLAMEAQLFQAKMTEIDPSPIVLLFAHAAGGARVLVDDLMCVQSSRTQ
jgi:hypothetical protein